MRYALILAGGRGSRLWPVSRRGTPKQFLPLIRGRSLLEWAFRRLDGVVDLENRYVCAGERHRNRVCRLLPELTQRGWLGEPCGRDTLAAVSFGFMRILQRDPNATIAMISADLYMTPADRFRETLIDGFEFVESQPDTLLTFGVPPTYAATGYGWIELEDSSPETETDSGGRRERVRKVRRFCEKPTLDVARRWYRAGAGRFLWNSGIFLGNAATFCELLRRFEPDFYEEMEQITKLWEMSEPSAEAVRRYSELKRTSVDYAILERAAANPARNEGGVRTTGNGTAGGVSVSVFSDDMEWSDVGSWTAAAIGTPVDGRGNVVNPGNRGDTRREKTVVFCDSAECSVFQFTSPLRRHRIRLLGVRGGIVVETDEIVLITTRNAVQRVRTLADRRFRGAGWCERRRIRNDNKNRQLGRKRGSGEGVFIDCDHYRFVAVRCPPRVVVLGVEGVDMVVDGSTITLVAGPFRDQYRSLQRLRKLEWLAIPGKNGEKKC